MLDEHFDADHPRYSPAAAGPMRVSVTLMPLFESVEPDSAVGVKHFPGGEKQSNRPHDPLDGGGAAREDLRSLGGGGFSHPRFIASRARIVACESEKRDYAPGRLGRTSAKPRTL